MEGGVPVVIFAPWLKSTFLAWSLYSFLSLLLSHVKHLAFFEREGGGGEGKAQDPCSHIFMQPYFYCRADSIDRIKFHFSTTLETKSCYCRVARQALPCYTAVERLGFWNVVLLPYRTQFVNYKYIRIHWFGFIPTTAGQSFVSATAILFDWIKFNVWNQVALQSCYIPASLARR